MKELHIEIYGRVQGINLRALIKSYADKSHIGGYVLNRESGSTFIVVQGERPKLLSFLKWIEGEPGLSRVEKLEYAWKESKLNYVDFKIMRQGSYVEDKLRGVFNLAKGFLEKDLKVPQHVAIIPDGNRRWAKERGFSGEKGHYQSASGGNITDLINSAKELGIKYLTIWGFSTENWKRDKLEINAIFSLIEKSLDQFDKDAEKNEVRFRHFGRRDRLPKSLIEKIEKLEKRTERYDKFNVQLCLDYGGRDEIIRAVNEVVKKGKKIEENEFSNYLDSRGVPDIDLIIRTSGEKRTSGLMPFQSVYAEFYFSDIKFPDFDSKELKRAVEEYSRRQRRFGGN